MEQIEISPAGRVDLHSGMDVNTGKVQYGWLKNGHKYVHVPVARGDKQSKECSDDIWRYQRMTTHCIIFKDKNQDDMSKLPELFMLLVHLASSSHPKLTLSVSLYKGKNRKKKEHLHIRSHDTTDILLILWDE